MASWYCRPMAKPNWKWSWPVWSGVLEGPSGSPKKLSNKSMFESYEGRRNQTMSHIFTTFVSCAMALRWLRSFSAPLKWKSGRRSAARAARMFTNNRSRIAAGGTKNIGLSLFHEGIEGLTCFISACIGLHKWVPPSGRLTEILIQKQKVLLGSYKLLKGS